MTDWHNDRYPGRPNYTGPDAGLALFVHHDTLAEYCWSFVERLVYIDTEKPPHERTMRRQWLVYIGDRLPKLEALGKAAWRANVEVYKCEAGTGAVAAREACEAYGRSKFVYEQARYEAHPQLEALRLEFAAEAPWDGKQLVFPTEEGTHAGIV